VHNGGGPGGTGRLAHPSEGRARQRDQHGMPPRVAVFLEMQQPERNRGRQDAQDDDARLGPLDCLCRSAVRIMCEALGSEGNRASLHR
jgi:hypothetical protein